MPQIEEIAKEIVEPQTLPVSSLIQKVALSFVVPVLNEDMNVRPLFEKLSAQLAELQQTYEVIFVDDGTTDKTFAMLTKLHEEFTGVVRVVRFRRQFCKTPPLAAGFRCCRGEIVFTMDGDVQDDPDEIPNFLAKLEEGY